jgi:fermentation-respiration switch protein FrsA (DUF1100 family)
MNASDQPRTMARRRRVMRLAIIAVSAYVVYCAIVWSLQEQLIYPRHVAGEPGGDPPSDVVVLKHAFAGGTTVAWLALPEQTPAPLVVFCHGNAELIDHNVSMLRQYQQMGCAVLMPEYRGYGRATGRPGQKRIAEDIAWFIEQAVEHDGVDGERIVYHGRSLGGAVAADLATRRIPDALILQSTFTSVIAMARGTFVPSFLIIHPYRTDDVLRTLDVPVLIMHGTHDDIIPVAHARALADLSSRATLIEFDCGHNDFPGRDGPRDWDAIRSFLRDSGIVTSDD